MESIPVDDRYLVEVLYTFPSTVLVTTDRFLQEQVLALSLRAVLFQDDIQEALVKVESFGPHPAA